MLHLLQQTLTPHASLRQAVQDWAEISVFLRENRRRREPQIENLGRILS
jgi:hypothetical protein